MTQVAGGGVLPSARRRPPALGSATRQQLRTCFARTYRGSPSFREVTVISVERPARDQPAWTASSAPVHINQHRRSRQTFQKQPMTRKVQPLVGSLHVIHICRDAISGMHKPHMARRFGRRWCPFSDGRLQRQPPAAWLGTPSSSAGLSPTNTAYKSCAPPLPAGRTPNYPSPGVCQGCRLGAWAGREGRVGWT